MTRILIIILAFGLAVCKGQSDTTKKYEYEICVHKNAKPGRIIKNEKVGIADTTIAYVSGQVFEKSEPLPFANVSFTNLTGQIVGATTDLDGNYSIQLAQAGQYSVTFSYIGCNPIAITKLKLGTGQMQEIIVDLGSGGGFHTYVITTKKPLTEKEYKAKVKELADN